MKKCIIAVLMFSVLTGGIIVGYVYGAQRYESELELLRTNPSVDETSDLHKFVDGKEYVLGRVYNEIWFSFAEERPQHSQGLRVEIGIFNAHEENALEEIQKLYGILIDNKQQIHILQRRWYRHYDSLPGTYYVELGCEKHIHGSAEICLVQGNIFQLLALNNFADLIKSLADGTVKLICTFDDIPLP